ncbi:hypothetical protein FRC12_023918 [Ceratobasidium sp. 428]|nr:hypothetical protein FRC12_023918 [Ceratobasidium sp. 428]
MLSIERVMSSQDRRAAEPDDSISGGAVLLRPECSDAPRNKELFPPGLDSRDDTSVAPYEFILTHLHNRLAGGLYSPETRVEHIFVASAEYCKQHKDPRHEFLIIQIKDTQDPLLVNYLVLDRTASASNRSRRHFLAAFSPSLEPSQAKDRIRVSYNGHLDTLVKYCDLENYDTLALLKFPDKTVPLWRLVAIAQLASSLHSEYRLLKTQCYWFAGLVWDSMRNFFPDATHTSKSVERHRGRYLGGLFRQQTGPNELSSFLCRAKSNLNDLESKLSKSQKEQERIKKEQEERARRLRELEERDRRLSELEEQSKSHLPDDNETDSNSSETDSSSESHREQHEPFEGLLDTLMGWARSGLYNRF